MHELTSNIMTVFFSNIFHKWTHR